MPGKLRFGYLVVLAVLIGLFLGACGETSPSPIAPATLAPTASGSATLPSQTGNPASPVATAAKQGASPKMGGTLRVGFNAEPDNLDPAKTATTGGFYIDYIYARLVHIGTDKLPHGWLAESWQTSDDGKKTTFKLRSGLTFHDGTPVDATAVKFSFDRILDPKTASPVKGQFGALQTVEVIDPLTVAFNFAQPFPSFINNVTLYSAGIVSPTAVAKYGDNFGRNPVGAGPFVFKRWDPGKEVMLARYADYRNTRQDATNTGPAYLDELDFKIIPQLETQIAALQTGAIDLIGTLSPQDMRRVGQIPNVVMQPVKDTILVSLLEFANKAPFNADPTLRQAVAYAIDKQFILDKALDGYGVLNPNPLGVSVAGWDESAKGYGYDTDKARSLLATAGWKAGQNGVLEKDGKPAHYTLLTPNANFTTTSATIIAANLKEVGIEVTIKTVDPPSFLATAKAGNYDMLLTSTGWYDASFFALHFKTPGWNGQFNDPMLDARIAQLDATLDPTQRLEQTKDIQQYINNHATVIPLGSRWTGVAFASKVQGLQTDKLGMPLYNEVWIS